MISSICLIFNRKCFVKTLETEHLSSLCDNWIIVIWTSVSSRLSIRVTVGNIFKSVIFLQPAPSPACSSPVVEISPPRLYSLFLYLNITALHWSVSQIPPRDVVGGGGGGRPAVQCPPPSGYFSLTELCFSSVLTSPPGLAHLTPHSSNSQRENRKYFIGNQEKDFYYEQLTTIFMADILLAVMF